MQVTRPAIGEAVAAGILDDQQARSLCDFLTRKEQETPAFRPAHILYYLGGLVAVGAMTLFMTLGWERLGGGGLVLIPSLYCALALGVAEFLLARRQFAIPAAIAATLAVVMVPLAVYGASISWASGHRIGVDREPAGFTMLASAAVEALQSNTVDLLQQRLDRALSGRQMNAIRLAPHQEPRALTEPAPLAKQQCDSRSPTDEHRVIVEHIAREPEKADTVRDLAVHTNLLL